VSGQLHAPATLPLAKDHVEKMKVTVKNLWHQ